MTSAPELFANSPSVTVAAPIAQLTSGVGAPAPLTVETWSVSAAAPPPLRAVFGQFRIAADSEVVIVAAAPDGAPGGWTVTRGAEGTTPVAHGPGTQLFHIVTAEVLSNIVAGLISSMSVGYVEAAGHSYLDSSGQYDSLSISVLGGRLGADQALAVAQSGSCLAYDSYQGGGAPTNAGWSDAFKGLMRRMPRLVWDNMGGPYIAGAGATLLMYGVNDMSAGPGGSYGAGSSRAQTVFINALRATIARARCAVCFPHDDPLWTETGSWSHTAGGAWQASGNAYTQNTATGTRTFWIPGDYEGGAGRQFYVFLVATGTGGEGGVSTITRPDGTTQTIDATSNTQADTSKSPVRGTVVVAKVPLSTPSPQSRITASRTAIETGVWPLDAAWSQSLPSGVSSSGYAQLPYTGEIVHYSAITSTSITVDARGQLGTTGTLFNAHHGIGVMLPIKIAAPSSTPNSVTIDSVGIEAVVPQPVLVCNVAKQNSWGVFWASITNANVTAWNALILAECAAYTDGQVRYVDTDAALAGGGDTVNPAAVNNFVTDGVHPSQQGHANIAGKAFDEFRAALTYRTNAQRAQIARRGSKPITVRVSSSVSWDTVALGTTVGWDTVQHDQPWFGIGPFSVTAARGSLMPDLKTILVLVAGWYLVRSRVQFTGGNSDTVSGSTVATDGNRLAQIMVNGSEVAQDQRRPSTGFALTDIRIDSELVYLQKFDQVSVLATSTGASGGDKVVQAGASLSIERVSG